MRRHESSCDALSSIDDALTIQEVYTDRMALFEIIDVETDPLL